MTGIATKNRPKLHIFKITYHRNLGYDSFEAEYVIFDLTLLPLQRLIAHSFAKNFLHRI